MRDYHNNSLNIRKVGLEGYMFVYILYTYVHIHITIYILYR